MALLLRPVPAGRRIPQPPQSVATGIRGQSNRLLLLALRSFLCEELDGTGCRCPHERNSDFRIKPRAFGAFANGSIARQAARGA